MKFALRADLKRHVKALHRIGQTMHACISPGCDYKTNRKDNIPQHMRSIHSRHQLPIPVPRTKSRTKRSSLISAITVWSDISKSLENDQSSMNLETFMEAATTGSIGTIKTMLKLGIDVSVKAGDGSTALHCAAKAGQLDMVRYLVEQGAQVDFHNDKGRTPLHEASLVNNEPGFVLLIDHGAVVSPDLIGDIIKAGHIDLLRIVFARFEDSMIDQHGQLVFEFSARLNSLPVMDLITSSEKVDRNWISTNGKKALYWVVKYGRLPLLKCLIESTKLDPNLFIGLGWSRAFTVGLTLLHTAVEKGRLEVFRLLLTCKSIDINKTDGEDQTPLQRAVKCNEIDMIRALIQHAEIIFLHQEEETPTYEEWNVRLDLALRLAISRKHVDAFKLLLSHLCQRMTETWSRRAYLEDTLRFAIAKGVLEIVQILLLQEDVKSNVQGRYAENLMILAGKKGHVEVFKLILDTLGKGIHGETENVLKKPP